MADIKKKIEEWIMFSGTIAASTSISGSIDHFTYTINMLQSVLSHDPSQKPFIQPAIDELKQAKAILDKKEDELLSTKSSDFIQFSNIIENYETLINKITAEELEIQEFFEHNGILINPKVKKLIPKKSLGGEGFPDFIAVLHDSKHIIIEIEKPTDRLYTLRGDPTAEFSHAEEQIRKYLKWANEEKEYLRKRGLPNIGAENTTGLVIIGKSSNLSAPEKEKLEMHNFSVRSSHEIKTFDQLLEENKALLENLKKHIEK